LPRGHGGGAGRRPPLEPAVDDVIDVLLPEESAAAAWSRLAELERANALLKRDVQLWICDCPTASCCASMPRPLANPRRRRSRIRQESRHERAAAATINGHAAPARVARCGSAAA